MDGMLILNYLLVGLILIAVVAILYLPLFFILRKRVPLARQMVFVLFAGCVFVVLSATLLLTLVYNLQEGTIFPPEPRSLNLILLRWMNGTWAMGEDRMFSQGIANLLMFVPLGLLIPVVFARARSFLKTTVLVLVCTLSIEFCQYFMGRSADIDDVLLNLLGGVVGYALFALLERCLAKRDWWRNALGL